jgi:hypothetical protein
MAQVTNLVDPQTVKRNKEWIITRRKNDKSGEFGRNPRALDNFGSADKEITDAYIVWSLTFEPDVDEKFLKDEFDNLEKISQSIKDPYFLALYSAALFNIKNMGKSVEMSERTAKMQNMETGEVKGAKSSICCSRGKNLLIETTSLCMMNWMNLDALKF